jgi:hypothetical protein
MGEAPPSNPLSDGSLEGGLSRGWNAGKTGGWTLLSDPTFHFHHELLWDAWAVPFAIVFNFTEHFNFPLRVPAAKRYIAYGFNFRSILYDRLQA